MSTITVLSPPLELQSGIQGSANQSQIPAARSNSEVDLHAGVLKKGRSIIAVAMLTLVLSVNSITTGLLTVGIPHIAADLKLEESLILW